MIAIVDYGMGNLRSAQKGFEKVGHEAVVTDDPAVIAGADAVVLPGVGAFKDCYDGLVSRGLVEPVKAAAWSGRPFLGICVGLQLLFEYGEEGPGSEGLGIFKGKVVRFPSAAETGLKVPHMGWNQLYRVAGRDCPLLQNGGAAPYTYFVHSYFAQPEEPEIILAESDYGVRFPAIIGRDNVFAAQFHPEKSQAAGLGILRAFGGLVKGRP
ncbi:MAG: imidazole glycerol phosphate synthase subunit HisH [Candidatus Hydrogenedentes bacterium]|nr:imidazole glycerol phosphate synthase subunit HisH [Candidatus Hydrogenedentota bacterium]MBI3119435.1 imidazole glycerol phosphate synthase subunit HisH [Candidatus Hydrogenedentota bacterium]